MAIQAVEHSDGSSCHQLLPTSCSFAHYQGNILSLSLSLSLKELSALSYLCRQTSTFT